MAFDPRWKKSFLTDEGREKRCKIGALWACGATDPVCAAANHRFRVFKLFGGGMKWIEDSYQRELLTDTACISILDEIWATTIKEGLELSEYLKGVNFPMVYSEVFCIRNIYLSNHIIKLKKVWRKLLFVKLINRNYFVCLFGSYGISNFVAY